MEILLPEITMHIHTHMQTQMRQAAMIPARLGSHHFFSARENFMSDVDFVELQSA